MPLDRYGVLIGTLTNHYRDDPNAQGRWFHVNLEVQAPAGQFRCAIDVDSKESQTGVEWKVIELAEAKWTTVTSLADGYHDLSMTSSSGAADYIRDTRFVVPTGCVFVMMPDAITRLLMRIFEARIQPGWTQGSNLDAASALEPLLNQAAKVFVFGEPFTSGLGMHNIHQNQGDPAGSQWWAENGTWQDGATIIQRADGSMAAFLNKFTSQSYRTDDAGHPAP